jgi:glutathione S-transferase
VRRVRVAILELGIEDRFEFVQTKWPHSWGTKTVTHPADFVEATPAQRIPALVTPEFSLTDSHSICDYINGELGSHRLLAREGAPRAEWDGREPRAVPSHPIRAHWRSWSHRA